MTRKKPPVHLPSPTPPPKKKDKGDARLKKQEKQRKEHITLPMKGQTGNGSKMTERQIEALARQTQVLRRRRDERLEKLLPSVGL